MATAKSSVWRPFAWTLAILCLAYLPLFLGDIIFMRDIAHWGFPARAFVRQSLLRGEFPRWNPYQGLGFPVASEPLYGIWYPPNWLFLLVGERWIASLYNWQCFLHMLWGALGVSFLARRLQVSATGIVVAGLAFALSGYVTSQWTAGLLLLADAWVPWAAVGQLALLDSLTARAGGNWRRGLAKAALPSVFACLLGEIFIAMIGAAFGVACAALVGRLERARHTRAPGPRQLGLAAAAVALAFGVSAVVILPASLLAATTERGAALSRQVAEACSLHPLRVLEFVAPQAMGEVALFPAGPVVGEASLGGLPLSYSMYLGASVVALALLGLGRRRRLALGLALAGLCALLLAFGRYTPVHGVFRLVARPLAHMRYPEKYTIVVVTVVALLAGLGAGRLLGRGRPPWGRTVGLLLVLVGCAVLARLLLSGLWMAFAIRGIALGAAAIAALLAIQFLARRRARVAQPLLAALVALDLARAAWPLQSFGPDPLVSAAPPAAQTILQDRQPTDPPPRIYRADQTTETVHRWLPTGTAIENELKLTHTLIANTANVWGIATLPGYDAAIPTAFSRVWKSGLEVGQSTLRLLGAEYAMLPVQDPGRREEDRPGFSPVLDPLPGARLYAVPGTLPRVYWAGHAEVLTDAQALARLAEPAVVAGANVLLPPGSNLPAFSAAPGRAGSCALAAYGAQHLVADCSGSAPGLAIFVEQYDPGWHATIDGRPVPIARVNLVMRGLALSPGRHHIVLDYATPGLVAGLTISGLCLVVLLALALPRRCAHKSTAGQIAAKSTG